MSELKKAIAYFEDAVRESDEIIADCSPALQAELTEQKGHFVLALEIMRRAQPANDPLMLEQMQGLLERLEAECREAGDGHEDYTNGYRWGHRNGQIELLRRILNVREGACESDLRRKPEGSEG